MLSLDVQEVVPKNNAKLIPQLDGAITSAVTGVNGKCIDGGNGYYTHPAFTFGNDELTGFWMWKFEISSETPGATNGGGESLTLTPRILPNVVSWRHNPFSNFWKVVKEMVIQFKIVKRRGLF